MGGLSVSGLMRVTVSLTPNGAQVRSFGVLCIAGDSNVINGTQRIRFYPDLPSVITDLGVNAPEVAAATLFFAQSPEPSQCAVGRWFSTASAAQNDGGILSSSQQTLNLWTSISAGAFDITIDGVAYTLTGLDFTACTNLNGVASVITAALATAESTGVCTWTGTNFVVTSGTTGTGVAATATATFSGTTTANDTITINGRALTFVSTITTTHQVLIGGTAAQTAANLQAYLMSSAALLDADLNVASYSTNLAVLTITYNQVGLAGNAFTLSKSSTEITVTGSGYLTGGLPPSSVGYATTGISAQLQLTSSLSQALVPGFAAESPEQCAAALAGISTSWYGLQFAATASITDAQHIAVCTFIEAQPLSRMYGATTQETGALSTLVTNDLASLMKAGGYDQSVCQYSSTNPYAVASLFGREFSVDFTQENSTITLMYKQEPGVTAENLLPAQAAALQAKNCNVFVQYDNDTTILQFGTMASGQFMDTIYGADWIQNALQTAVFNTLYTATTKVLQTDSGADKLTNAMGTVCGQAVTNGYAAPGIWNGPSFGQIITGQYLKTGFYIYMQPMALQSETDRQTRVAPPSQIALKLGGAIHTADLLVDINQ